MAGSVMGPENVYNDDRAHTGAAYSVVESHIESVVVLIVLSRCLLCVTPSYSGCAVCSVLSSVTLKYF